MILRFGPHGLDSGARFAQFARLRPLRLPKTGHGSRLPDTRGL
jgi:hypothetical protein